MARSALFHPDFKAAPYWWEAYQPTATDPVDVPARVRVAIVGDPKDHSTSDLLRQWNDC